MIRCQRAYCGGVIICDGERTYCLSCNREPNVPEPLPLVNENKLPHLVVLTDGERALRSYRAKYMRQRRWRESHLVSKKAQ